MSGSAWYHLISLFFPCLEDCMWSWIGVERSATHVVWSARRCERIYWHLTPPSCTSWHLALDRDSTQHTASTRFLNTIPDPTYGHSFHIMAMNVRVPSTQLYEPHSLNDNARGLLLSLSAVRPPASFGFASDSFRCRRFHHHHPPPTNLFAFLSDDREKPDESHRISHSHDRSSHWFSRQPPRFEPWLLLALIITSKSPSPLRSAYNARIPRWCRLWSSPRSAAKKFCLRRLWHLARHCHHWA